MKPKVFIGSSKEDERVARAIQANLDKECEAVVWEVAFGPGGTTIESLAKVLDSVDYAVMVLSPNDKVTSRGKTMAAPRDNVLFELGLFMGRLGHDRCFSVIEGDDERGIRDVKLPSDLSGVTAAIFTRHSTGDLRASTTAVCYDIMTAVRNNRARSNRDFCDRITGHWWELLITDKVYGMSYLEIESDAANNTVKMQNGRAFDLNGNQVADWNSVATCVNSEDRKIFYYWKGKFLTQQGTREGFGEIQFTHAPEIITSGSGSFSDTNLNDLKTTHMKSIQMRRATEKEKEDMEGSDSGRIKALVNKKLKEFRELFK